MLHNKNKTQNTRKRLKSLSSNNNTVILNQTHLGMTPFDQINFHYQGANKLNTTNHNFDCTITSNKVIQKNIRRSSLRQFNKSMGNTRIMRSTKKRIEFQESQIHEKLMNNRFRVSRLKTELAHVRNIQLQQYQRKSLKYRQLLDLNNQKKERFQTLNTKVGEVIKKAVETEDKQIRYSVNVRNINLISWKPECRQGHSTTIYKNHIFLIGGHCSVPFGKINMFSVADRAWVRQINCEYMRSYHSIIVYKNRLVIVFGGMGTYNPSRKIRNCFNTVFLLDMQTLTIKSLSMKNQSSIQPRRSHTATLLGYMMLVFGGITQQKQYLSDLVYLELKEFRWYCKQYNIESQYLEDFLKYGLAEHVAISTYKVTKTFSFYSSNHEEDQSLLIFGGQNSKEQQNILFRLVVINFIPTFKLVHYSGAPTSMRYPLIEKYKQEQLLIVAGEASSRSIILYNILQKKFTNVILNNSIQPGGIRGSINYDGDSYYVFFGLTDKGYKGSLTQFDVVEQQVAKKPVNKKNFLRMSQILLDSDQQQEMSYF